MSVALEPKTADAPTCHLCESGTVALLPSYPGLARVTSDCWPWPRGGKLGVCGRCGAVQKVIDEAWTGEIRSIYEKYTIYHQSGGVEQAVFDAGLGAASSRSKRLLEQLGARFPLAEAGRLLDVGCGNGGLLRAFSAVAPGWSLAGTEWDGKYRREVESIPGVEALYTGQAVDAPGEFDLITMIHVLEHIPSPRAFLRNLRAKLRPGGLLVVQLPDHRQNPFELLIADHASHFAKATVASLLEEAGYEVLAVADDWVAKELSVVARPARDEARTADADGRPGDSSAGGEVLKRLRWLDTVARSARDAAAGGRFGLFGTSIAATWLAGELGETIGFFVDEDPSRVGREHLGRPIYHPGQVPAGSRVFLALPPAIAEAIARRVARDGVDYILSPPLPA